MDEEQLIWEDRRPSPPCLVFEYDIYFSIRMAALCGWLFAFENGEAIGVISSTARSITFSTAFRWSRNLFLQAWLPYSY